MVAMLVNDLYNDLPPTWESVFIKAKNDVVHIFSVIDDLFNSIEAIPQRDHRKVFRAFYLCKLTDLKLVILGKEPTNHSDGLAYSTTHMNDGETEHIIKCLCESYPGVTVDHFRLDSWARQGVLLLNCSLTAINGEPGAFKQVWNGFLARVLEEINSVRPYTVYTVWDSRLYKMHKTKILAHEDNVIVVDRIDSRFKTSRVFKKINNKLDDYGMSPIRFDLYNEEPVDEHDIVFE